MNSKSNWRVDPASSSAIKRAVFVALYEMKVLPGREKDFEESWATVTDAILKYRGSRGSRLHKTDKPRTYIAYAQWPSKAVYHSDEGSDQFSEAAGNARQVMRDCTEYIKTLHLMEIFDDRLK